MENELRYYLNAMKEVMKEPAEGENRKAFVPTYFVTAVKLPTGAIELAVNTSDIPAKIDYILEAYDDDMHLKANHDVIMTQLMIV